MLFLLGSIILTSFLTLWFKLLQKWKIPNFQAIVFNYFGCVITGSLVNGDLPLNAANFRQPWFLWACLMGFVFIALFNIIGYNTQKFGVAITSVANKLSLVIPFIFSIYLYNEKVTLLKIAGVIVALVAVALTCWPKNNASATRGHQGLVMLVMMTAILFVGSGMLDTMIKYVEQAFLNNGNRNDYLITAFAFSALIGSISLVILLAIGRERLSGKAVLAGLLLGVPNYFSIWCLVQVLKIYGDNSSAIIPINNMGIVLFSSIVAWLAFGEKLSKLNWTGIALALAAIALIAYG